MAYEGTRETRGSRQQARGRERRVNGRVRGLRGENHPYRWCPAEEVSILVGPNYLCPACGKLTTTA